MTSMDHYKHIGIVLLLLLAWTTKTGAQTNRLYMENINMEAGRSEVLHIGMENKQEIVGVQFTLKLPEGFSLEPASVTKSSRLIHHEVLVKPIPNGGYLFVIYSMSNMPIEAIQGELLSLSITASHEVDDNKRYHIEMTDAVMTLRNGMDVLEEAYEGYIDVASQPNLHVVSVDCSEPIAGKSMTVSWRVRNDGTGATGDVNWKDYVWLTPDVQGGLNMTGVKLLATVDHATALGPGEWYDKTISVLLEEKKYGNYHIVVTTDMYGFNNIDLGTVNGELPPDYQPETGGYGYLFAQGINSYDLVKESGEFNGRSDNFFYKPIYIAVPPLPNIRVDQIKTFKYEESQIVHNLSAKTGTLDPSIISTLYETADFFSSNSVILKFKITNIGEIVTPDTTIRYNVFLSQSDNLYSDVIYKLKSENVKIALPSGQDKEITVEVELPYAWNGDAWFHVQIDSEDVVYEGAATADNWGTSNKINITQCSTADYEVTSISAPHQVTLGMPFNVQYAVKNSGPGDPNSGRWYDALYISSSVNGQNATHITSQQREAYYECYVDEGGHITSKKLVGDNYSSSFNVVLRDLTPGTYYLFVKTDINDDVYEYGGENNNMSAVLATVIVSADLTAELLSVSPTTLYNKSKATFSWKVKNIGGGNIQNAYLTDAFYAVLPDNGGSVMLGQSTNMVSLASGGEKVLRTTITLPDNPLLVGALPVYVQTNTGDIPERVKNNNTSLPLSQTFSYAEDPPAAIEPDNRPNLVVSHLILPDTVSSGEVITVNCVVRNTGLQSVPENVSIEVFMSGNSVFRENEAVACTLTGEMPSVAGLASGNMRALALPVTLPGHLKGGKNYLHVLLNRSEALNEVKYSDNHAVAMTWQKDNLPDLTVNFTQIPLTMNTSVPYVLEWEISNVGSWNADEAVCDVYLSKNGKDEKLLATVHCQKLKAGQSATQKASIEISDDLAGLWDLTIVADSTHQLHELSTANNRTWTSIEAKRSPLPDIQLTNLSVEGRLRGGDSITVRALITNVGSNSTHKDKWADVIYLSSGYELNPKTDLRLGAKTHVGELGINDSYELIIGLHLPESVHGYYLLYAVADDGQTVFEDYRDNNKKRESVFITNVYDTPAELTVSNVNAPAQITAGAPVNIGYLVTNNGIYEASGMLRDVIYLSEDDQWDENDEMIGTVSGTVNIAPGGAIYREAHGRITKVAEGNYHIIVRTNSTHSIVESNYANNTGVQSMGSTLSFANLTLGSTVGVNTFGCYKIVVEPTESHPTYGFRLQHPADAQSGLYVAYNRVPNTARYDYASSDLLGTEQVVLVPNVQRGTYYVLARSGVYSGNNFDTWVCKDFEPIGRIPLSLNARTNENVLPEVSMSLTAEEVHFGATRLSIADGGTDGWVTTEIQGALFDSIMDFRLEQNMQRIPIESMTYNDQTSARVIFNLNRAATGVYDVVSELPDGTQATLPNGFTVVPGVSTELGVKLDGPKVTRIKGFAPLTITYVNSGNTDIVIRGLLLTINGGTLANTVSELNDQHSELYIYPGNKQDSRGYITIPPGKQETITCYFRQTHSSTRIILYLVK